MIEIKNYDNGLTLVYQQIQSAATAAYVVNIPTGIVTDPIDKVGRSLILADLISRRAGPYSDTEFMDKFDSLGVSHSESAKLRSIELSGYCLQKSLYKALDLTKLMIEEPYLEDQESLESAKKSYRADIMAIEDEPRKKASLALRERYFPEPYNRSVFGDLDAVEKIDLDSLREGKNDYLQVKGSVLSIVAPQDFTEIDQYICENFIYNTSDYSQPEFGKFPDSFKEHINYNSEQVQIYLACPAPAINDDNSVIMRMVDGILSGGMFGRLFSEVREKRGLCYSVNSSYSAVKEYGQFLAYAGTTTDRASETLTVMRDVISSVKDNITDQELGRVKTDILSALIISRESSFSKAASQLMDYKLRGRVRTIEEIKEKVNQVSISDIVKFLEDNPIEEFSVLTLGSKEIN